MSSLRKVAFVFPVLLSLLASPLQAAALTPVSAPPPTTEQRIAALRADLAAHPNAIASVQAAMLQHKLRAASSIDARDPLDAARSWEALPALQDELDALPLGENGQELVDGMDVLTGTRAIDESLQLGSVGTERDDPLLQVESQLRNSITSHRFRFDALPAKLEDLRDYDGTSPLTLWYNGQMRPVAEVALRFDYRLDAAAADGYVLTIRDEGKQFTVADLGGVDLKSHDWAAMLGAEKPEPSAIMKLVPRDDFVVQVDDAATLDELDAIGRSMVSPLNDAYGLGVGTSLKQVVLRRLGIGKLEFLKAFVGETAIVMEDFDAPSRVNLALIMKPRAGIDPSALLTGATASATVGDYLVVATSQATLERMKSAFAGTTPSMFDAPDYRYTLTAVTQRSEGMGYISEDFVRKLTSARYRVGLQRRNAAQQALLSLQYVVYAYRVETGQWPKDLQQVASEGYIDLANVAHADAYTVAADGVVTHRDWGSVYAITPVEEVAITTLTSAEKHRYENFREGYQQYWREFVDPVGIGISLTDRVTLHTVILPLIDQSEYNDLKAVFGGAPVEFEFLQTPDRPASIQFLAKWDLDAVVGAIAGEFSSNSAKMSDAERKGATEKTKQNLRDFLGLPADGLAFTGDEVMLGMGEKNPFTIDDLDRVDVWIGMELTDVAKAKAFMVAVWQKLASESRSSRGSSEFGGLFRVSDDQPLKNTYNGTEYFLLPTGFVNVYYAYLGNRVYLTISQSTMNKLIDAAKAGTKSPLDAATRRTVQEVGSAHNIMFLANLERLDSWKKQLAESEANSVALGYQFRRQAAALREALTLAKALPDYQGTLSNVARYYPHLPTGLRDATYEVTDGTISLKTSKQRYPVDSIRASYGYDDGSSFDPETGERIEVPTPKDVVKFEDVAKQLSGASIEQAWGRLTSVGLGFSFTEDGLDIRVAMNNPERTDAPVSDARPHDSVDPATNTLPGGWVQSLASSLGLTPAQLPAAGGMVVLIAILIAALIVVMVRRSRGAG